MTRGQRQSVRKPATKFAHLRKKMSAAKTRAGVNKAQATSRKANRRTGTS